MTDEQLTRGKVLSDEIKELKNRIYKWRKADMVQSLTIHYPTDYPAGGNDYTDGESMLTGRCSGLSPYRV